MRWARLARHWPPRRFQQAHLAGRHGARNFHQGGGRLLEGDLHVGMEPRALQPKRQAGRQVAQIRTEVEITELDARVGFACLCKRGRFGGGVKAAATQLEGQARRSLDLSFGLQVASKRNRDVQLAQLMRFL